MEAVLEQVQEDFNFYGAEAELEETKEVKGITDDVTGFTYTNVQYPCIVFKEDFKCPKHQLKIISNMVNTVKDKKDISLYFLNGSDLYKLGELSGLQVSAFLEMLGCDAVYGYYDADTKLEGSMLYALCSAF